MIDYEIVKESVEIFKKLEKLIKSEGVSSQEILMCAMRQGFLPPVTKGVISDKERIEFVGRKASADASER